MRRSFGLKPRDDLRKALVNRRGSCKHCGQVFGAPETRGKQRRGRATPQRGSCTVTDGTSSQARPRPQPQGTPVKARLKWFNPDKGFGFVSPVDGSPDAFLHVSALQRLGLTQLPEGTEMVCEVASGPKGPQVLAVVTADLPVSEPPADQPSATGIVKWFASEKGFGFITADDGGKDIFIHKSVLRRCGLGTLNDGQRVRISTSTTPKGREATWIAID